MMVRKTGVMILSKNEIHDDVFEDGGCGKRVMFVLVVLLGGGLEGGDRDISPPRACRLRVRTTEWVSRGAIAIHLEAATESFA